MKRSTAFSPVQAASFSMGRVAILFETWWASESTPLEFDRALLLDFGTQYPRSVATIVPQLVPILRAHGMEKGDLGDLFAQRRFATARERFAVVVSDLMARNLLTEEAALAPNDPIALSPTTLGLETSRQLCTSLSIWHRAVCRALCEVWKRSALRDLSKKIRMAIPDHSLTLGALAEPFFPWEGDRT